MKRIAGVVAAVGMVLAAGVAVAWDGYGPEYYGGAATGAVKKFQKETLSLRDDMVTKQMNLDAEYQKARNALDDAQMKILLRDAQRAWIAYRDAFAELYVTRWRGAAKPDVLRSEIVAQLSRDRAAELRE